MHRINYVNQINLFNRRTSKVYQSNVSHYGLTKSLNENLLFVLNQHRWIVGNWSQQQYKKRKLDDYSNKNLSTYVNCTCELLTNNFYLCIAIRIAFFPKILGCYSVYLDNDGFTFDILTHLVCSERKERKAFFSVILRSISCSWGDLSNWFFAYVRSETLE